MEKIFQKLSLSSASLVLILLLGIFITLFNSAKPAIDEFGAHFLVDSTWNKEVAIDTPSDTTAQSATVNTTEDDEDDMMMMDEDSGETKTIFGGLVPIIGTVLSTLIALTFAMPIAMGIAVFLAEMASKSVSKFVGIAIELLAAIPSIIFGMWGLYYFAPIISETFGGYQVSLLTAGLVLGIMILPFMAAITRDSMNTTPDVLKESAYALGATKFEVVKDIIFPYSKIGIIGSIILALGRALGETMAVAFLIGGVYLTPQTITDPTISIPVAMAVNFGESSGLGENALFYLGLILFIMSFAIISIAKFYFLKRVKV